MKLEEKTVSSLGRASSRLLTAGFILYIIARYTGHEPIKTASTLLALAGLIMGTLWLLGITTLLRREGNTCILETYITMTAWLLTPWGIYTGIKQIAWEIYARLKLEPLNPSESDPLIVPPFRGCWAVVNGGITVEESHSWGLWSQRYAYDMMHVDDLERLENQCRHRTLGSWATYGSPVYAAMDGTVVKVVDGARDNTPVGRILLKTRHPAGNYIVIRHGPGLYSLYAHLKQGSITVREGDEVKAGEKIGEAGNSGMSTAPHLHFQLMTTPDLLATISVPFKIAHKIGGEVVGGYPRRGATICTNSRER